MADSNQCYTYRNGKKVDLVKRSDRFIVRRTPEAIEPLGLNNTEVEQVSGSSSRVQCQAESLEPLMAQARQDAVSFHDYETAEESQEFLITDRIFVTFKDILSDEQVNAFASKYYLTQLETYSPKDYLFELTTETGINPVKLIVQLTENDDLVEIAEHSLNHRATAYNFQLPADPNYAQQWHLHNNYNGPNANLFDQRSSSRCKDAWEILQHYGCKDVVIGITDDGCKLNHEDFNSTNKFAGWGYFQGRSLIKQGDAGANSNNMYQANANHGTACAGVSAAEQDSTLTVGAAAGCRLLPIKWQSQGRSLLISDDKLLTALNYVADKVDILSNSWGASPRDNWAQNVINRITQLAQNGGRRGKGIIFLWAAGNENCPISHQVNPQQPAVPYDRGVDRQNFWRGFPVIPNTNPPEKQGASRSFEHNIVGIPGVMMIAALGSTAQRSNYSNYGTGISLCAPSSNSHAYPRSAAVQRPSLGLGITTDEGDTVRDITADFGGTSSATPLTAGIAALVISANPTLSATQVISILQRTASKDLNFQGYPVTAPDPAIGDPNPATWDVSPIAPFDNGAFQNRGDADGTWSPWFGHGRVDAAKAVTEALLPVTKDNVPNQYYRLVVEHSGKIVEVKDSSQDAGTVIQQNEWNGGNNQQWQFQDAGDGYYFIVNKSSNQIIAAHSDGSAFQYGKNNQYDDQKWKLVHASKDFFYLQNKSTSKVLGISESKQDNGTHAIPWDKLDISDQHWRLEALPIPNQDYRLVAQHSGKVLDLNNHYGTGFTIKQNSWTGRDDQKWQFQEAGDGYYLIINKPRLNQGPYKITSKNDTDVVYVYGTATYDDQKWKLEGIGAGFFSFSNKVTGKCIGISQNSEDDGAVAIPSNKSDVANQHFKFEAV